MKKLTALVLALALTLALLPVSAFAADRPQGPFDDISGESNQNSILWCYDQGLLNGTGNGHFSPDKEVTRAMAATVLFRSAGNMTVPNFPFKDVPANSWYAKPVQWAYACGYISGTSSNTFSPDNTITRQDLVLMLRRQACCGDDVITEGFTPADYDSIAPYARNAVCWAYREGILRADKDGNLNPAAKVTRGELASILKRVYDEPKQAFEIEPANITELSIHPSYDDRYVSSVPAERVEKIVEYLNSFAVIEKEAPVGPAAHGGVAYYMEFTSHSPDTNGLNVNVLFDGSLEAYYRDSDSPDHTLFIGKQPATALLDYLDEYFKDIPVDLFEFVASGIDKIYIYDLHKLPRVSITAPEEIQTLVDALNSIEVLVPGQSQDTAAIIGSYRVEIYNYAVTLGAGGTIILTKGEDSYVYNVAGNSDSALWALVEEYCADLPDKGTPPED